MSVSCIIALIALIVIIFVGLKFDINLGLLGLVGAYVFGAVIGGLPAGSIIGLFPSNMMIQVMCIMLFFSVAVQNGTFNALADKIIYLGRNIAPAIPFILYLAIFVIAATGTGSALVYFMALPVYIIAKKCKMNLALIPVIMIAGINGGGWQVFSNDGAMNCGILTSGGFDSEAATAIASRTGVHYIITSLILFAVGYIVFRGWKCQALNTEKPADLSKEQKRTLYLVAAFLALYLVPTILNNFTDSAVISAVTSRLNLYCLSALFALACLLLKLSDIKSMVAGIPWVGLLNVCGMATYMGVCNKLGLVDFLANSISNNISTAMIPSVLAICGGFMSLFSATMGVVLPTFYPIIFQLAGTTGLAPALMASSVAISAGMSGISPFSTMGAVTYSAIENEEDKKPVFISCIATVAIAYIIVQGCILTGIYNI